MKSLFDTILNPAVSPLRYLPPAQRFQMMLYLSMMWTAIFCTAAGAWLWYGHLMVAHTVVVLGFAVTGWTFHSVRPEIALTYRDHPRADGTPRYDDVWGA